MLWFAVITSSCVYLLEHLSCSHMILWWKCTLSEFSNFFIESTNSHYLRGKAGSSRPGVRAAAEAGGRQKETGAQAPEWAAAGGPQGEGRRRPTVSVSLQDVGWIWQNRVGLEPLLSQLLPPQSAWPCLWAVVWTLAGWTFQQTLNQPGNAAESCLRVGTTCLNTGGFGFQNLRRQVWLRSTVYVEVRGCGGTPRCRPTLGRWHPVGPPSPRLCFVTRHPCGTVHSEDTDMPRFSGG